MVNDNTDLIISRPPKEAIDGRAYTLSPDYYKHQFYEDKLAILVCQIKIWKPKGHDWFTIPAVSECLTIRECESIEVSDSSKELLNKAVVRFPRGTVISLSSKKMGEVLNGNKGDNTNVTETLVNATNDGEVITKETAQFKDNAVSTTSIAPNYDDKGLIDFNRSKEDVALLSPNDVATGNRIEIRVGYAYSENEFLKMNKADNDPNMHIIFTGFITSISVSTPLELECTNMAHVLACISAPRINVKDTLTVKDFLDPDGKYKLLEDTGIELAECTKKSDIVVSGGSINENLTVADVLNTWAKAGVMSMMVIQPDGSVRLRVGLTYYAGKSGGELPNNDKKYITYNGGDHTVKIIQFDWDVAEDKLTLMNNDKKYIAIEATGRLKDGQFLKLTVRKNPNLDDEGWVVDNDGQFQVVNEKKTRKPTGKRRGGSKKRRKKTTSKSNDSSSESPDKKETTKKDKNKIKNRVDLDKYNVVPYVSIQKTVTRESLIEEAKQYWGKYVPNGIKGGITIFGDIEIRPTDIIGLIDIRQPEKNGYYFVEAVNTNFGIDGYRREIEIPFKIASFKNQVKYIP